VKKSMKNSLTQFHVSVLEKFLSKRKEGSIVAMQVEQPESLQGTGGKYVDKPGLYHAVITGVDENPASKDGEPLNGVQFTVSILAGTSPDQKDKSLDIIMWNPRDTDEKKKQDDAKRVQTNFCLATCLIGHFEPGAKVSVEPTEAIGRQVVVKLRYKQKKNEQTGLYEDTNRIELSWSDIYHVDDPWVANNNVPMDSAALAPNILPPSLRKITKPAPSLADVAASAAPATAVSASASAVDVGDV
jgi:hypothetical protein